MDTIIGVTPPLFKVPRLDAYPKGTPKAVIDKLQAELKATLATPEVTVYMSDAGIESVGSAPAEMDAFFREERDRWARVVKDTGAKID
jgi:tripartite-type tricarboxylate transporter receptor subunit TctC